MKLRIQGNSVRLRLEADEVEALIDRGRVEQRVSFGPQGRLEYALELGETDGGELAVRYRPGAITVLAEAERARTWARSEEVGLEERVKLGDERVSLLVEKDFPCRHRDGEDA